MKNNYLRLCKDTDGILEISFDQSGSSVNTMGSDYDEAMREVMALIEQRLQNETIKGIYVCSAKPGQFFAGGDIKEMLEMELDCSAERRAEMYQAILATKSVLRRLETLGVPVAVGINGACLGGGYEIALSCHYRVAVKGVQVGLPESAIGLMPGAGGVVRLTYLLGIQAALPLIAQGKRLRAEKALSLGLVDEVVDDEEQLAAAAKHWILSHPQYAQPWDRNDYKLPGGDHSQKEIQNFLYFGPANVLKMTKGLMPAQQAIFACVSDITRVDFDTAQKIEARYFLSLLLDQTARNMMLAFFVQMERVNRGGSRPEKIAMKKFSRIGIIGAGQMGAGIAVVAAQRGIDVVLKDVDMERAQQGLHYCAESLRNNPRVNEQQAESYLNRITVADQYQALDSCQLVIEAVFENRAVKAEVTKLTEAVLPSTAVFATNTSALPITELAHASCRAENFIGMHFFSPAEKMPLVEIICGIKTSEVTLAAAFDLAQQLGKTPIVVNDGPGFFTSRVISRTISQSAEMVVEGINPVLIEAAARDNGSPVGPLAAIDEISQETAYKNGLQVKADVEAQGGVWQQNVTATLMDTLVNQHNRRGKRYGGGYYDYPKDQPKRLWPGLQTLFAPDGYTDIPYQDIKDRLLFSQSLEAVRALQEGVLRTVADGNIGSILGIGFPAQSGGVLQFINAYGVEAFIARSEELATRYGDAFTVPQLLYDKARANQQFL